MTTLKYFVEYIDPTLGEMSDVWSYETLVNEMAEGYVKVLSFTNANTNHTTDLYW